MLRRRILIPMALVVFVVCILIGNSFLIVRYVPSLFGMRSVTYQGEQVRLSKRYFKFDEYRQDPDNIDAAELERVEALVKGAKVPPTLANQADLERAIA